MLRCGDARIPEYASCHHALPQQELPVQRLAFCDGVIAQLGERLPCTQEVSGSIPLGSTNPSGLQHCSEYRNEHSGVNVDF